MVAVSVPGDGEGGAAFFITGWTVFGGGAGKALGLGRRPTFAMLTVSTNALSSSSNSA